MSLLKRYVALVLCGLPLSVSAQAIHCSDGEAARAIQEQRAVFNQALVEKNIDVISRVLLDDVILITGTDSEVYEGRQAQLDLWSAGFEQANHMVYIRTPDCIDVSSGHPIALERGRWRGMRVDDLDGEVLYTGRYSAKWRFNEDLWQLEVETYMTDCSEAPCDLPEDRLID